MSPGRWPPAGAVVVAFLAVTAQVPWRPDALYEGGADPVVVAKAGLTLLALLWAVLLVRSRTERYPVPASPFLWVGTYLACTLVGAATDGRLVPSAVLAVRVLLVLLIVGVLVRTYRVREVLHATVVVFAVLVTAATATTLALGTTGRLHGGLPPLHANELAALTVICLLWAVGRLFRGGDRISTLLFVPLCVWVVILTESRTSLVAGFTALAILALFATRIRVVVVLAAACVPPLVLALSVLTPLTDRLITRGEDAQRLATFADRLYAWEAAIAPGQPFWHQWFGGGLSQKTVQVTGQWWTEQVLDSSWVSALVQAGWLGLAVVLAWTVTIAVGLVRTDREWRGVLVALVVFLAMRGLLESGLFDASTSFIVLCVLAFAAKRGQARRTGQEPVAATAADGTAAVSLPAGRELVGAGPVARA